MGSSSRVPEGIGVAGLLIGGWPIYKEAFENIVERRMIM